MYQPFILRHNLCHITVILDYNKPSNSDCLFRSEPEGIQNSMKKVTSDVSRTVDNNKLLSITDKDFVNSDFEV